MSASSRGWHAASALSRRYPRICSQCARARSIQPIRPSLPRTYSSAAAADVAISEAPVPVPPTHPRAQRATHPKDAYRIRSGLILTRAPLLTREPTPFEAAFFLYQKRLNERLTSPFVPKMYFKQDTPPALDWEVKIKERQGNAAKEIGLYRPKQAYAYEDELMVGDELSKPEKVRQTLVEDAQVRFSDDGELLGPQDRVPLEKLMPRRTEADEKGDLRRLDRTLDRTLYLVVQDKNGYWGFPVADVPLDEALHQTAARVLEEAAGVNMNTWIVGRAPVAHLVNNPVFDEADSTVVKTKGVKTFYLKGRIMAGQADIEGNPLGITDFKWLTREELKETLHPRLFSNVSGMMCDR